MPRLRRLPSALLLVASSLPSTRVAAQAPGRAATVRVLEDVTLVDGTGGPARAHVPIVIRDGVVSDVFTAGSQATPAGAEVVGRPGQWVIPGLIDAHVHLATDPSGSDARDKVAARVASELRGGVTTVRDMAGDARAFNELARAMLVGDLPGPDAFGSAIWAGADFMNDPRVATSTRGTRPGVEPWMRTIDAGTDFRVAALEARAAGVRGIKLYADVPAAVARAAVPAAHAAGLRVWAHATTFPARPSDLVGAGVDVVSHAPLLAWEGVDSLPNFRARYAAPYAQVSVDAPALVRLLARMASQGTMFEPTLYTFREDGRNPGMAAWARAITGRAARAGVPIVAGTDNMIASHPDSLPHLHDELALLVDAGLTPAQAIQAATATAARAIGIEGRTGTVRPGMAADLVVLAADPLADIANTRRIVRVLKHGAPVER